MAFAVSVAASDKLEDPGLDRKRRWFRAWEGNKKQEQEEARLARKYYHDKQWTEKEVEILRGRGQQATVRNRVKRKIDFLVGTEQRLRRDPKAYPRTPQHEKDADVATAGLRYVCDQNLWSKVSSDAMHDALVSGIGVTFIGIEDEDPVVRHVSVDRFFYDPRAVLPDFSDARYMGLHLWLDIDEAKEKWPKHEKSLQDVMDASSDVTTAFVEQDRQDQWGDLEGRRVRVVEFWELRGSQWHYCYFTGDLLLEGGPSPYQDEKGKPDCPYVAWSPYIDERGDRYGLVRTLKSIQDEINYSASKYLHRLATRQFFYQEGAVEDIDAFSQQITRPDGKIKFNPGFKWGEDIGLIDDTVEMRGEAERHAMALSEMENYGPNPGLTGKGEGVDGASGRALLAQRDSGMTELSPVFERQRDWKLRCYRKMWARIRQAWTGEKWIRITDDQNAVQFVGINQYSLDPQTMQLVSQNVVAQLDVDIILDEGPDTIVMNEELMQHFSSMGEAAFSPAGKLLIELSNVNNKDRLIRMIDEAMQAANQGNAEQAKAQAQMQQMQMKAQQDQQKFQADMAMKQADMQIKSLEFRLKQLEAETKQNLEVMKLDSERQKLQLEQERQNMDMERMDKQAQHETEMLGIKQKGAERQQALKEKAMASQQRQKQKESA